MDIYKDSCTVLSADGVNLYINYRGEKGTISRSTIKKVRPTSEPASEVPKAKKATESDEEKEKNREIDSVTIDSKTESSAYVFDIPGDGDGYKMIKAIEDLLIFHGHHAVTPGQEQ